MRVDILQAFAICGYGNQFLLDPTQEKAPELRVGHSTFKTVYEVAFERKGMGQSYAAEGVSTWLKRLRAEGVERLSMVLTPCGMESKASDEAWGILTDSEKGLELWQPTWKKRIGSLTDVTPWLVVYAGDRFNRWNLTPPMSVTAAEQKLREALESAGRKLGDMGFGNLSSPLQKCLELHDKRSTEAIGIPDLCPQTMDINQRALACSAMRIMLVISSGTWSTSVQSVEIRSHMTMLWTGAMFALEATAHASGYRQELAA